jgi:hypothetical protein
MKTKYLFYPLIILVFLFIQHNVLAQDNSLYFHHEVPQSISLNPAVQYKCEKFIELPLVSSIKLAYNNSSFSYSDLIKPGTGAKQDSFVIDLKNLSGNFKNKNYINAEVNLNILGFGMRYKQYYFTFNVCDKTFASFVYPKSLEEARKGNWNTDGDIPRELNVSGTKLSLVNYMEFSLGAARNLNEFTSVGLKLKYLKGGVNISTKKSDTRLITEDFPITKLTASTDFEIKSSLPITYTTDNDGWIDKVSVEANKLKSAILSGKNKGFAIDLGVIYSASDQLTLAASLLDVGFISWSQNLNTFSATGSAVYQGYSLSQLKQILQGQDISEMAKDTLLNAFQFSHSAGKYMTILPAKAIVGADYVINDYFNASGVLKLQIMDGAISQTLTGTINAKPAEWANLSMSLSYMNRSLLNIGWAFSVAYRNLLLYCATEKLPLNYASINGGAMIPYSSRSFNVRFGLNIVFGCKQQKTKGAVPCPAYNW